MMPQVALTITVRDDDDQLYMVTEIPGYSDISTADGFGYFVCEAGPVICIEPETFEIWVTDEWGPHKVIARTCHKH